MYVYIHYTLHTTHYVRTSRVGAKITAYGPSFSDDSDAARGKPSIHTSMGIRNAAVLPEPKKGAGCAKEISCKNAFSVGEEGRGGV